MCLHTGKWSVSEQITGQSLRAMNFKHSWEKAKLDMRHLLLILPTGMEWQIEDVVLFLRWVDACIDAWRAGYQNNYGIMQYKQQQLVHNRCFHRRTRQTPHQLITVKKANLSEIQKFRSVCYTYKQEKDKTDSKCVYRPVRKLPYEVS